MKVARAKIWLVRRFQGQLEGSKSMIVDPWIQDHSILTIGANRLKINPRDGLEDLSHALVMCKGQVGHGRCLCGTGQCGMWGP